MSTQFDLNSLWESSGGDDLLQGKTFQQLFDSISNKMAACSLNDHHLRCIDEGTNGGFHLAGSGILYHSAFPDLRGKVTGLYSHEGCGAAAKFVKDHNLQTDDTDKVGDEEAQKLADRLGVNYLGRITASDMSRPIASHIARAVYVTLCDFDPSALVDLPKGFVISRQLITDSEYAQQEIELARAIAFGPHGFGTLFTIESPFYIVIVLKSDTDPALRDQALMEAREVADKNIGVRVDTITY